MYHRQPETNTTSLLTSLLLRQLKDAIRVNHEPATTLLHLAQGIKAQHEKNLAGSDDSTQESPHYRQSGSASSVSSAPPMNPVLLTPPSTATNQCIDAPAIVSFQSDESTSGDSHYRAPISIYTACSPTDHPSTNCTVVPQSSLHPDHIGRSDKDIAIVEDSNTNRPNIIKCSNEDIFISRDKPHASCLSAGPALGKVVGIGMHTDEEELSGVKALLTMNGVADLS